MGNAMSRLFLSNEFALSVIPGMAYYIIGLALV